MNNKKLFQIVIIIVVAVWAFCASILICSRIMKSPDKPAQIETTAQYYTLPCTTVNNTTAPTDPQVYTTQETLVIDGNNVVTVPDVDTPQWKLDEEESKKAAEAAKSTTKAYVPSGKSEIIGVYVSAVNKLKSQKNFSLAKNEKLNVTIDEISGGTQVKELAEKVVAQNTKTQPESYTFKNGMDDVSGLSPTQVIAPAGQSAQLDKKYVTDATAKEGSDGSYTIKITLAKAVQTLDSPAPGYSTVADTIDLEKLGLSSSITVESLNITYDKSTIEARIDKNGRIVSMTHKLIVTDSVSEGKLLIIPASIKMHGDYTCDYRIVY